MIKVTINEKGGPERVLSFDKDSISLGRSQRNDVILPRSNVSKKHATIVTHGTSLIITDQQSTNGTFVNGRRLTAPVTITKQDKVFISDFVMVFESAAGSGIDLEATFPPPLPNPPPDHEAADEDGLVDALTSPPLPGEESEESIDEIEPLEEEEDEEEDEGEDEEGEDEEEEDEEEDEEVEPLEEEPQLPASLQEAGARQAGTVVGKHVGGRIREVEAAVFKQLDTLLDLERVEPQAFRDKDFRKKASRTIAEILDAMVDAGQIPPELEPSRVTERIAAEVLELGPLDGLLEDPAIHEVVIPARGDITVRTDEGLRVVEDPFVSTRSRQLVMRKLRAVVRGQQGEGTAALSGQLDEGQEVFMLMPPIVMEGMAAVIRKPPASAAGGMEGLVERGILSSGMARFLGYCVEARQGILICDPGLGSHRTLVPAVVSMLEPWERVLALQCGRVPLFDIEAQVYAVLPSGSDDSFGIDAAGADLVQVIGAFKPSVLVAGGIDSIDHFRLIRQARSSRAFMLATIDADSEMDGLARLGGWLAREHSIIPRAVATGIMLDAVDIVVFHTRMMDGSEKITRISELLPGKEGLPALKPVFHYEVSAVSSRGSLEGSFRSTRHVPRFMEKKRGSRGVKFDPSIFH